MRKLVALAAVIGVLALSLVASAPGAQPRNVDPGGGGCNPCSYIASVYTYYNGYWHWINCEYLIFPWGTVQSRCW
jgi:hypothetical protein